MPPEAARERAVRRREFERKDIAIFEPDLTETTTLARAKEFVAAGFQPIILGFRRGRYNRTNIAPWREIELGNTRDGQYWKRVKALICALPVIVGGRRDLRARAIFLARNLDQLLLALFARFFFNPKAVIAYEVVDIQPAFTRHGLRGAIIRATERACLKEVDLLAVSSPAFCRDYFQKKQRYRGPWVVVENKLRLSSAEAARALQVRKVAVKPVNRGAPWRIGYFGLIRGQATIELMMRLAIALPEKIEIEFRGIATTVDHGWFHAMLAQHRNVRFGGEYRNPDDLPDLYSGVDFAWAIDLENTDGNSRWLLPCRFYEAGLVGVPCLAAREFEIGQLLDRLDLGWTFADPVEASLIAFFDSLSPEAYAQKRRTLLACPADTFMTGDADDVLPKQLTELAAARRAKFANPKRDVPASLNENVLPGSIRTD